ncbi:MAG: hypothetical protein JWM95_4021 [Gemmatimonadetes bacterium]|nr:hypothetical protein [Gemmatimonadota bacterium]
MMDTSSSDTATLSLPRADLERLCDESRSSARKLTKDARMSEQHGPKTRTNARHIAHCDDLSEFYSDIAVRCVRALATAAEQVGE